MIPMCPKCHGLLRYDRDFPGFVCYQCGRVDYLQDVVINDRGELSYSPDHCMTRPYSRRGRTGYVRTPTSGTDKYQRLTGTL